MNIDGNDLEWLKWLKKRLKRMKMDGNSCKLIEMDGNGWKVWKGLECLEMDRNV